MIFGRHVSKPLLSGRTSHFLDFANCTREVLFNTCLCPLWSCSQVLLSGRVNSFIGGFLSYYVTSGGTKCLIVSLFLMCDQWIEVCLPNLAITKFPLVLHLMVLAAIDC